MHRLGTVLAASHHDDELRRAALMRQVQRRPKGSQRAKGESKPSLRERVAAIFRPVPIRPAGA